MKLTKDTGYIITIILLLALSGQLFFNTHLEPELKELTSPTTPHAYYNQDIKTNEALIDIIKSADSFAYFAVYTFTRKDIKDALIGAKKRGVDVRGITDIKQITAIESQRALVKEMREAGIPIVTQDHVGLMHIKLLVTEKSYATGSYNWTAAATTLNDEVLEIGSLESLRSEYEKIFLNLFKKYQTTP